MVHSLSRASICNLNVLFVSILPGNAQYNIVDAMKMPGWPHSGTGPDARLSGGGVRHGAGRGSCATLAECPARLRQAAPGPGQPLGRPVVSRWRSSGAGPGLAWAALGLQATVRLNLPPSLDSTKHGLKIVMKCAAHPEPRLIFRPAGLQHGPATPRPTTLLTRKAQQKPRCMQI